MKKILLIRNSISDSFIDLYNIISNEIKNSKNDFVLVDLPDYDFSNTDDSKLANFLNGIDIIIANREIKIIRKYADLNNILIIPNTNFLASATDKWITYSIATKNNILVPKTVLIDKSHINNNYKDNFELLSSNFADKKFVIKGRISFGGYDVHLIENENDFKEWSRNTSLEKYDFVNGYIAQEYLEQAKGVDYRVLTFGEEVIVAIKRVNDSGDFRSNVSQGGKIIEIEIPIDLVDVSKKIHFFYNSDVCGIDFLFHNNSFFLSEVNTIPGLSYNNSHEIAQKYLKYVKGIKWKK